jgi:hypothetical protein
MTTDTEALNSVDTQNKGEHALAEEVMQRCIRIVANVNRFKQPRLATIEKYRNLYAGKMPKKLRQLYNVTLPVFSGAMDTLMAGFNDDLALEFKEGEPADYLSVRKLNTLWDMETNSVAPNAKFPLKARWDRSNAMFSGRGFMMNYAISEPKYHNCFEVFELEDAIFQPNGGGHLESHLYAGRQNIVRSASQLKSGSYEQAQVKKFLAYAAQTDFDPAFDGTEEAKAQLQKFKAMGLAPEMADYVGEQLFKLVEMAVVIKGVRYHIVFSPWYQTWFRFDKLKTIFSADLYPWVTWATHEDNKNFLSKSYADDLYGVADAVHTMFNQELTNREKRNFHGRAYDMQMFPDVAKLDLAQTRPDALVPVDTKNGTRKIADGIFTFETAELQGTINLIEWIQQAAGTSIGVTDLQMGGEQNVSKKATVAITEQQNVNKRLLLRSSSYTEAMGEIGKLFIQGCKDHLPAQRAIRILGADGERWEEIKRADLDLYSDIDVRVVSSSMEMRNSQLKKEARIKVLEVIGADPILAPQINPSWRAEELLRSGGEYDDEEIKMALDTKNYGSKEEVARAHQAIQSVLHGEQPEMFYGATTLFMQVLVDFASDNRTTLGAKFDTLIQFASLHAPSASENMARKAQQIGSAAAAQMPPQPGDQAPAGGSAPLTPPVPSQTSQMNSLPTT